MLRLLFLSLIFAGVCSESWGADVTEFSVDFTKPEGTWELPALGLGQGGLQSDAMLAPFLKELRELRPRTIRVFLDEYYRVYPGHGQYDWTKFDRELRSVREIGARPIVAIAIKPPVLYPEVNDRIVRPNDYNEWETLCEALARHCREAGFQVAGWEVGNEPDIGESGGTPYLFTPEEYVIYYSHTTAGLLRGDPEAQVGGPAIAYYKSPIFDALINGCADQKLPLHFLSWHVYSDSPEAHAESVAYQRARLAKRPELQGVKLMLSEWNMDLMHPNLAPGFQPAFILETMRRLSEAGLDRAAYYHVRDCFVDPADFDWMSPGGVRFMAHWWNIMPQYSGLFDHHGRVRPAWYAFRLLGQFDGPRFRVNGETGTARAIAGEDDGFRNVVLWNFSGNSAGQARVRLVGVDGHACRVVQFDPAAANNNLRVIYYGNAEHAAEQLLELGPYGIYWVEVE